MRNESNYVFLLLHNDSIDKWSVLGAWWLSSVLTVTVRGLTFARGAETEQLACFPYIREPQI